MRGRLAATPHHRPRGLWTRGDWHDPARARGHDLLRYFGWLHVGRQWLSHDAILSDEMETDQSVSEPANGVQTKRGIALGRSC